MKSDMKLYGNVSKETHKKMSKIKSKDTHIELALRKALWEKGYRYRKNYKKLPGTPDIALTKYRIAVFCDGEFFHGKDWKILKPRLEHGKNPKYWVKKIERNMERDIEKDQALNAMGWIVIHFWGEDILNNTSECVKVIEEAIFEEALEEADIDY